jgi:hypothetical protein
VPYRIACHGRSMKPMASATVAHRASLANLVSAILGSVIGFAIFASGGIWAHQAIMEFRGGHPAWGAGSILFALATPCAAIVASREARRVSRPVLGLLAVAASSVAIAAVSLWVWFGVAMSHGLG